MYRALLIAVQFVVLLALVSSAAHAADSTSPIGKQMAEFQLDDFLGSAHASSEWKDKKALVVVFLGAECPLAKLYGRRLAELDQRYHEKGVQFVGINSNQQDTLTDMAHYARVHKIDFPLLKDPGNKVADQFGAARTPEVFLLDESRTVRYWGAIDDQYGVGFSRPKVDQEYLVKALDNLLAGQPIEKPAVASTGCLIGRISKKPPTGDITYTKHIAPILNQHCVACHREGQVAPFVLTAYDDIVGWGETICEVIDDQRMPPWHANPKHGEFSNDARLPDDAKQLVKQWVKNGMPQGDPADLPPQPKFAEGWRIPTPDLIVKMPKAYNVPAKGTVPYQYFTVDPGFKEDMWVKGAEARPGNPAIVHHMILFYMPPTQKKPQGIDALGHAICSFAPGMPANVGPDEYSRCIPAGSKLVFQMHYTPNGSEQTDISEAGIVFADPKKVKQEIKLGAAINWQFKIPPGADNHPVEANHRFQEDVLLYSLTPHMHLRGKSFRFTAVYPDNHREILLDVPHYDFNWQNIYLLKNPKLLPQGTDLLCEAHFDNSEDNKANPDPSKMVYWGDQTWEEMVVGTFATSLVEQDLQLGLPKQIKLDDGKYEVTFRYKPAAPIDAVFLAGEFNKWIADELKMDGPDADGFYTAKRTLDAGRYEYKFVVNGKHWKPDTGNRERTQEFHNSVLHVGEANNNRRDAEARRETTTDQK